MAISSSQPSPMAGYPSRQQVQQQTLQLSLKTMQVAQHNLDAFSNMASQLGSDQFVEPEMIKDSFQTYMKAAKQYVRASMNLQAARQS
jgi:hypothetical protein